MTDQLDFEQFNKLYEQQANRSRSDMPAEPGSVYRRFEELHAMHTGLSQLIRRHSQASEDFTGELRRATWATLYVEALDKPDLVQSARAIDKVFAEARKDPVLAQILGELNAEYDRERIIEALADLCHQEWSGWMLYLFSKSTKNEDGSVTIPEELVVRWVRQMSTHYNELSGDEQDSDRKEATHFLPVVERYLEARKDHRYFEMGQKIRALLDEVNKELDKWETLGPPKKVVRTSFTKEIKTGRVFACWTNGVDEAVSQPYAVQIGECNPLDANTAASLFAEWRKENPEFEGWKTNAWVEIR